MAHTKRLCVAPFELTSAANGEKIDVRSGKMKKVIPNIDAGEASEVAALVAENERLKQEIEHLRSSGGQPSAPPSHSRDQSTRHEADDSLRLALEAAQLGVWDWDISTGTFHWSERCKAIHGVRGRDRIDYDSFLALLHPDDRARIDAATIAAVFDGTMFEVEYRCLQPNGTTRWIALTGRSLYGTDGRPFRGVGVVVDVTSRKEIEAALRESEAIARARAEELETLMDTAPAGVFVAQDPRCLNITANRTGRELLRIGPTNALPLDPSDIESSLLFEIREEGHVVSLDQLPMHIAARTGKVLSKSFEVHFPDGLVRFLFGTAAPLRDSKGGVRGAIGTFLDVTEQKLAERELARSRHLFERIAATTPDILFVYDVVENRCIYANKALLDVLGYLPSEINDSDRVSIAALIHPDDLTAALKRLSGLAARPDGEVMEQEHRVRHANGEYRWTRLRSVAFSREPSGALREILGLCHDTTEARRAENALRASETLYRSLTELSPQIVWTADARGILDFCNQNWMQFSGMSLAQSANRGWLSAVHPDFRERVGHAWNQSMSDGRSTEIEVLLRRHDGTYRWHLARTVSNRDAEGRLERWIGIALDIDERKRAEDALREHEAKLRTALASAESAREAAETADRAKDQFLAVLSHELRTPLTPVLMAISAVQMMPDLPEPVRGVLQMIRRNIQLESRLIDDLLDITRIARGKMEYAFESMDLHEAVARGIEICALEVQEKAHDLVVELSADSHCVRGDFARLQQVVWNLIKNAAKFTPRGGRISIRTANSGANIRIEVADNGIGIASDVLPAIFNPFEQGTDRIVREFGGLGLGLAIARATIEAHGGHLTATSDGENRGALFIVELPTLP